MSLVTVVDESDRGTIDDQRAVGLAGLGNHRAVDGAGREATAAPLADQRRTSDHGGVDARASQDPREHASGRALPAGPRDGDARPSVVDDRGEQGPPRG